jgi:uncharacterized protein (DUF927 family)
MRPTRDEMLAAARKLWGPETEVRGDEIRWDTNGSKALDLSRLVWHDHEANEGGGYKELFRLAGIPLPNGRNGTAGANAIVYPYQDEGGSLLFEVLRFPGHKFRQRRPNGAGGWTWKLGQVRRVLYRLPQLCTADPAEPVFVVEGEKDVDNLRALGLIATCNPGGAGKWRQDYSDALKGRDAILLPDNDDAGREHARDVADKIIRVAGSVRILELPGLPEKGDVSDWLAAGHSKDELIALGQAAPPMAAAPEPPTGSSKRPNGAKVGSKRPTDSGDEFNLDAKTGLSFQPPPRADGTDPSPVWLCAAFEVLGDTADERDCQHGLWLSWIDDRGARHTWALPMRLVHAEGGSIAAELHGMGLRCATTRRAHDLLRQYLGSVRAGRHVRCVERAGWHVPVYVLPSGRTFGGSDVVMQGERAPTSAAYAARGSLADWEKHVAGYAVGNSLFAFSISAAFAPPLLDISGHPSGGVNLWGGSQTGKTTMMRGAASVWGPPEDGLQLRSWRSTANGLEGAAAETCDGPLFLDEIGQADAREVSAVIYMLGNQAGKGRATKTGAAQPLRTWRSLYLSTGEMASTQKVKEAGMQLQAGGEVRLLNVAADGGAGRGVWENLHGQPDGASLTDHLRDATRIYCGTAAPAFLEKLVAARAADPGALAAGVKDGIEGFLVRHLPADADGQVRSAAVRFGLIAVAGELAVVYGVLPWQPGTAIAAAAVCFRRWIMDRGGKEASEDIRAVRAVCACVSLHGASRFEPADAPPPNKWGDAPTEPRIINRLGFVRTHQGKREFMFLPEPWRDEVCRGLNPIRVARVLKEKGLLLSSDPSHLADKVRVHGFNDPIRLYRVCGTIVEWENGAAPSVNPAQPTAAGG